MAGTQFGATCATYTLSLNRCSTAYQRLLEKREAIRRDHSVSICPYQFVYRLPFRAWKTSSHLVSWYFDIVVWENTYDHNTPTIWALLFPRTTDLYLGRANAPDAVLEWCVLLMYYQWRNFHSLPQESGAKRPTDIRDYQITFPTLPITPHSGLIHACQTIFLYLFTLSGRKAFWAWKTLQWDSTQ